MNQIRKIVGGAIAVIVIVLLFLTQTVHFITEYQWFADLGYTGVFLTRLRTQLTLGSPLFLAASALFYLYFRFLKTRYTKQTAAVQQGLSEQQLNRWLLLPAGILGLYTAINIVGNYWWQILQFMNQVPYGLTDPIFNRDLSFYFFTWPLLMEGLGSVISILVMVALVTFFFYLFMMAVRRPTLVQVDAEADPRKDLMKKFLAFATRQLVVLGVLFFAILTIRYLLSVYELLYSPQGAVFGAGYTDMAVGLPLYRIKAVVSLAAAVLLAAGYNLKRYKLMAVGPVLLVLVTVVGGIAGAGVERFVVEPNVLARETPYIMRNIEYTRIAYGLDNVMEVDFNIDYSLTREDLEANPETVNNIRINDYRPALLSYNQLQAIRPYYQFADVDIDRYVIDGDYRQVFLAARELNMNRISESAKTWLNMHLKYTHGYGAAVSPVNAVTPQGQPELFVRNIPPVSSTDLVITRPEVYFGELTNHYIVVNTDEMEFDYPMGEDNAETMYEGAAGIRLNGVNRLLYAMRERSARLFLSGSISGESRIIFDRNIMTRVNKIAPFLLYDEDPYLVIHDGRMFWIIDAFTIESNFPYSTPYLNNSYNSSLRGEYNYMRNSVKVVIDAYEGDVQFYIADAADPVIQTYANIFPGLFQPLDNMREGLRSHIRYPQEIFDLQTIVYERYHMANPSVFYLDEDLWNIAQERYAGQAQKVESQYMIFKLPGEGKEEFILSVPYTPNRLNNMIAILAARNDGEHYGELVLYQLPKDQNIYGPMQIEARIDQNEVISQSLTLWGEGGSTVIRGNLLVIPMNDSLLYIEPLYIQATNSDSPPEVKQVIAAFEDDIVMADTLEAALTRLFGAGTPQVPEPADTDPDQPPGETPAPVRPPVAPLPEDLVDATV
ncbi:MAG: UPF0182 family protein, partial [Bacillota bacterium]|nr:UPF0182 family protein [Bacillota bacterium]